jgi:cell division protein FtsB
VAGGLALVVISVAALSLFGFPLRTWFDQQRIASAAEQELSTLRAANADAAAQVEALQSDAEIERLAREDFGYAKAGEEVYRVLPPARDPVRVPDAWPFNGLGSSLAR